MQKNRKKVSLNDRVSGFTLIELMVTVALISVLLGIAVPSFSDFLKRQKVKSEAQSVARVLSSARANAIVLNSGGVLVVWNITDADETINELAEDGSVIQAQTLEPGAIAAMQADTMAFITVANFSDSSGVVFIDNDDDQSVIFTPKGRMLSGLAANTSLEFLICRGAGDAEDAIRVEVSATGRVVQKLKTTTDPGSLDCPTT